MKKNLKVGFIGMSHLGLNYAVATAKKNFNVICYDENKNIINSLNKKKSPIFEKNLNKNIKSNFDKLKFTSDLNNIKFCDVVYISKDVETDEDGKSDLKGILGLIDKTLYCLNKNACLVILCQVPPGFCKKIDWKKDQLFYQVETLIFGQALYRALHPERIIIGTNSKKKINKSFLKVLKAFNCPLIKMKYESAELAKISINAFLISTVTTTNILSEICEKVGGDWNDIANSLRLDKRIGKYAYLKPGLGISGGNLERDLYTIKKLQKLYKLNDKFITELQNKSISRKKWILNIINKLKKKNSFQKITILGLAYKEGTHSVKNSPALYLIKKLSKFKIKVFDPVVKKISFNRKNIYLSKNINEAIRGCDILIVSTPWSSFKKINISFLEKNLRKKILIDPYNLYDKAFLSKKINHICMGKKINV